MGWEEVWRSGCPSLPHPHAQLRSGERIKLIPLLCITCTSVVWGFALFFFFQGLSTWQVSSHPAEGGGGVAHTCILSPHMAFSNLVREHFHGQHFHRSFLV